MSFAITLHLWAAVIWIGGMFFAYLVLRPAAAAQLEPPVRLALWAACFDRFFLWVWLCVAILPVSGFWMITVAFGGMANLGLRIHLMYSLGTVMIVLFLWLYFVPFMRLKAALTQEEWPEAGRHLDRIRGIVAINLALGLLTIMVAAGGRYF